MPASTSQSGITIQVLTQEEIDEKAWWVNISEDFPDSTPGAEEIIESILAIECLRALLQAMRISSFFVGSTNSMHVFY
jgi:hypothetical protein